MRVLRTLLPALMFASLLGGCGSDDEPTSPEATELQAFVGTWNLTSFLFVPVAGGPSVDQVDLGFVLTLTIQEDGTCIADETSTDGEYRHMVGELIIPTVGQVFVNVSDEPFLGTYDFTNGGQTLILESDLDWSYDFDGDGMVEAATVRLELAKVG
jgi:hypothetical protein